MKRENSSSMFLFGLMQTVFRYIFILLAGILFLIIGFFGIKIFKSFGVAAIIFFLLLCIVEQLKIHLLNSNRSDNQEFRKFLDSILGIRSNDEKESLAEEKILKNEIDSSYNKNKE